jgi:diaminopimelate epimerase
MTQIRFAKMHGLGNDFMVLDLVTQDVPLDADRVRAWADRHTGVGYDQLLTIEAPSDPHADFRYRIYNADGSEVEQCGNGARCVARLINELKLSPKQRLRFQTSNGEIETRLLDPTSVEVDMGVPRFGANAVPFAPQAAVCADGNRYRLECDAGTFEVIPLSMGNPHGVIFVDEISEAPVAEVGAALTAHPFFPARANIGFCQIVDDGFIRLRVFERGVGETRACGTGACAAAVAGRLEHGLSDRIKVSLPGGKVRISWPGENAAVTMTGPATLVFLGTITI